MVRHSTSQCQTRWLVTLDLYCCTPWSPSGNKRPLVTTFIAEKPMHNWPMGNLRVAPAAVVRWDLCSDGCCLACCFPTLFGHAFGVRLQWSRRSSIPISPGEAGTPFLACMPRWTNDSLAATTLHDKFGFRKNAKPYFD